MNRLTLNLDELKVNSFETTQHIRENRTEKHWYEGWSDASVCPTTEPSRCRVCY